MGIYLHGIETLEQNNGPRPVETINTGIIGLIGTAPNADPVAFPLNTPIAIYGLNTDVSGLGSAGTLLDAINGIFDQASRASQTICLVRVAEGGNINATMTNLIGDSSTRTGMHAFRDAKSLLGIKPKLLVAPGFTSQRPTDGIASIAVGASGNVGYTSAPAVSFTGGGGGSGASGTAILTNGLALSIGAGGTGYTAAPTLSIPAPPAGGVQATATATVTAGVITAVNVTNAGSGYLSAPTITVTPTSGGTGGVINAALTGRVGSIKINNPGFGYTVAPTVVLTGGGFTTTATATATLGTVSNPVTAELLTIANRLRACVIKDAPATTSSAAITDRGGYDTDRLLIIEPMVKIYKSSTVVSEPASARIAGLQARVDYEEGFWVSPSNHVVEGVIGVSRNIEHSFNDPSAESQLLNQNAVACVVRATNGGFKLWGSRVPSSDTLKQFWSVRRSHDTIIESIEIAAETFIDKPFSLQALVDIAETVNSALRRWQAMGATLGGRVWLDSTLNTKETWASGQLYIHYNAEAPAPIEHITFVFNRNTGYYDTLAQNAVREVARLQGAALTA